MTGWAKTLSQDEGPNGITVNSIAPGYIDTERMKNIYAIGRRPAGDARRSDEALIPARRFGDPAEIGDAVAFLCSTRAAYISGITVLVDGGLAKGLPELRLTGKTIVVTGGSSGLGRAMSLAFAAEGAHVVVGDIRTEPREGGEPTVDVIAAAGRQRASTWTPMFPPGTTSTGWSTDGRRRAPAGWT